MGYAVGIDIGGTKIAIGLVNKRGELKDNRTIPMERDTAPAEMVSKIADVVRGLVEGSTGWHEVIGIGVGAPGPLNLKENTVHEPPNLPGWRRVPIVSLLEEEFSLPVYLQNDATAAALAEKWLGAAQNSNDFIYLTISTGIGAGMMSGGKLISGTGGNAGEVGHIVVDPSYGKCTCGQYGCLEWIASGTGIARHASARFGRDMTSSEVMELYRDRDPAAVEFIEEIFSKIGTGCVSLINMYDPEIIVVGGGVSNAGEPLFHALQSYVSTYALNSVSRNIQIVPTSLGSNNGLLGAAALVYYETDKNLVCKYGRR
ncbi:ROK family protein [Alteribacillus sp. HJP-4]|uniref:ROK family protein n=1 Tax=Alteribacillus sp. HJP-4 TaxID=2775394 RepID=UPI0035CD0C57